MDSLIFSFRFDAYKRKCLKPEDKDSRGRLCGKRARGFVGPQLPPRNKKTRSASAEDKVLSFFNQEKSKLEKLTREVDAVQGKVLAARKVRDDEKASKTDRRGAAKTVQALQKQKNILTSKAKDLDARIFNDLDRKVFDVLKGQDFKPSEIAKEHGMGPPESMWSAKFKGISFHGSDTFDKSSAVVKSISALVANGWPPESVVRHTTDIYFTSQKSEHDSYWQKAYGINGFETSASGGDGKIVVYKNRIAPPGTIKHEMAHNLAKARYGKTDPPRNSDFGKAFSREKPPPTRYARESGSIGEDFAESVAAYLGEKGNVTKADLKKQWPKRYAVIDRMVNDETYKG